MKKQKIYVSLVKDFICCYIEVEIGTLQFKDEWQLRKHLNEHYRNWWCSTYTDLKDASKHDYKRPTIYSLSQFDEILQGSSTFWEATENANKKFRAEG